MRSFTDKKYYDLGARNITLAHSRNNDICDSSTDPQGAEHGGLSEFGMDVVRKMNELGMMIDVSHISDEAFYYVIEITGTPVIASHSNARFICNHPRNLDDYMLLALKENGGVIEVCILSAYVKTPEPNPERDAAIQEVRGRFNNFIGLTDAELEVGNITLELLKRGYTKEDIEKIWSGNFMRVFREVEDAKNYSGKR